MEKYFADLQIKELTRIATALERIAAALEPNESPAKHPDGRFALNFYDVLDCLEDEVSIMRNCVQDMGKAATHYFQNHP